MHRHTINHRETRTGIWMVYLKFPIFYECFGVLFFTLKSNLFKAVQERSPTQRAKMLYTEESMVELTDCRVTPSSISDPCTAVPMPTRHPTTFNLYMAPSSYPVRARQIDSTEDFVVSWLYMQPTVIFPLQTSFRTMVNFVYVKSN